METKLTKAMLFIAVMVCIFALPQIAGAEECIVDGTNATLTYSVSGTNATITDCNEDASGELVIPSTIGDYTVTGIGKLAFENCSLLTKVTVPDSVTSIEAQAFAGCDSLKEMTLPFIGGVKGSGNSSNVFGYIFEQVSADTENVIIQQWGSRSYDTVYSLIPETLKKVTITNDTSIGKQSFANCVNIKEIIFTDTASIVNTKAFYNCPALETVRLPENDSLGYIYDSAFEGCVSLKSINIPSKVSTIYQAAFKNCKSLESVVLPETLSALRDEAFYGCTSLSQINIPGGITAISEDTFTNVAFLSDKTKYTNGVLYIDNWVVNVDKEATEVILPENVKAIVDKAFAGCTELKKVYIPQSVKKITRGMFTGCSKLEEMTLPFIGGENGGSGESTSFGYIFEQVYSENEGIRQEYENVYYYVSYYSIPQTLKKVTITAENSITYGAFQNCSMIEEIHLPIIFSDDNISAAIRSYAFDNCTSLRKINIPADVTGIDRCAFRNCSSLEEIVLPANLSYLEVEVFSGCSALRSVEYPVKLATIPEKTFYGCTNLKSVIMQEGLVGIGKGAFYNCTSLDEFTLPLTLQYIDKDGFTGTALLNNTANYTEGILYKDGWVLSTLENLTTANIEDKIKRIAYGAFGKCTSLSEVVVPSTVEYISVNAFENCSSLKKITLPFVGTKANLNYNVESVFGAIFGTGNESDGATKQEYTSRSYTYVMIPSTLTEVIITGDYDIPYAAFDNCSNLTSITLSDNVQKINQYAFRNCSNLTSFVLPAKVTEIPYCTFYNCTNLKSIEIPELVTSIGSYAFYNCKVLESIKLPKNLKTINQYAFDFCESIKIINVPETVTSIGNAAFRACTSIEEMTLPFVGTSKGNTGIGALFGYVFGTYTDCPETTQQYYTATNSVNYAIPRTIKKVTITDETAIGYGAFYGCDFIDEIIIESDLTSIGLNAFSNLGLEAVDVTIKDKDAIFGDGAVFDNSPLVTVYGYSGSTAEAHTATENVHFVAIDGGSNDYTWRKYRINSVSIKDSSNAYVNKIPDTKFTLEVNLSNIGSSTTAMLAIVGYDSTGAVSDIAIAPNFNIELGQSDVVDCIINNTDAKAAEFKIFVWSNSRIIPLAGAKRIAK